MAFTLATSAMGCATASGNRFKNDPDLQRAPDVCVSTSKPEEINKRTPEIFRDFNMMAALPLTGEPIYNVLGDSSRHINACIFYVSQDRSTTNSYAGRRIMMSSNAGTTVTFHESFHAKQDVNNGLAYAYMMTSKDAAIAMFLSEATAVAYELAARREAENNGQHFNDNHSFLSAMNPFSNNVRYRSDDPENRAAFNNAYKNSWRENASMDARTREAKALEAGGKAVVLRLMEGRDQAWSRTYVALTIFNINNNRDFFTNDGRERLEDYRFLRNTVYTNHGNVSSDINFTPDVLLGNDANQYIDSFFHKIGLKETDLPLSPQITPITPSALARPAAPPPPPA